MKKFIFLILVLTFTKINCMIAQKSGKAQMFSDEKEIINDLKFGQQNQVLAILENSVKIWNNSLDSKKFKALSHDLIKEAMINNFNNNIVVTASKDGSINTWDLANTKVISRVSFSSPIDYVGFIDKDNILAVNSNTIQQINIYNGKVTNSSQISPAYLATIAISQDNKKLAYCLNNNAQVSNIFSVQQPEIINNEKDQCYELRFSPNSNYLAISSRDGKTKIYDLIKKEDIENIKDTKGQLVDLQFSKDNNLLAIATDYEIKIFDLAKKSIEKSFESRQKIYSIAIDSKSSKIAVGDKAGYVKVFDINSGNLLANFFAGTKKINALAFDNSGNKLISANEDGKIYLVKGLA